MRHPTFLARLNLPLPNIVDWAAIDRRIEHHLGEAAAAAGTAADVEVAPYLGRIASLASHAQETAGLPVFEPARILQRGSDHRGVTTLLACPYAAERLNAATASLSWAARFVSALATADTVSEQTAAGDLGPLMERLRKAAPRNSNSLYYLKAAHARGTPWDLVEGGVYRFGWGAKARLMRGSFTEASGAIGADLARNKHATASVLRQIGLPAPEHRLVTSAQEAVDAADALGFPVVVKPADKDGGVGVAVGLVTPDQVRAAFADAGKLSGRILVEKHAPGQDYRLAVFNGEMIWAILRRPGGVDGDGVHTVRELVEIVNADPRRGDEKRSPLKRLKLDDEALQLLAEASRTAESIPPSGHFVRLRRAANTSMGGTAVAVVDKVHPDNRQLAIDVAHAVRLDLMGMDILIEDIARSWHEVGAVICEVNADPQLGFTTQQHLYGDIIGALCGGSGRIPTVVVGGSRATTIVDGVAASLTERGLKVGVAHGTRAQVGGRLVTARAQDPYAATQSLLSHRDVEAVLVAIDDDRALDTSLPFDRIDILVIAGPFAPQGDFLSRLTRMLAPNSGTVFVDHDVAENLRSKQDASVRYKTIPEDDDEAISAVAAAIGSLSAHVIRDRGARHPSS